MRSRIAWLLIALLLMAVCVLLLRIVQPQLAIWGPAGGRSAYEVHYDNMVELHQNSDAALPPGRVIFLGDSITLGLPVSLVTDLGVNYGIASDDNVGLLRRLQYYDSIDSAAAVVLAMGVNDIMRKSSDEDVLADYRAVLDELPVDIPVMCSAILPIDEPSRKNWGKRSNARITAINSELRDECESRGHLWHDASAALADGQGNLNSDYHPGDGLHLNAIGNSRWALELQRGLSELGVVE